MPITTSYDWIEIDGLPNGGVTGSGFSETYVAPNQAPADGELQALVEPVSIDGAGGNFNAGDKVDIGGVSYTTTAMGLVTGTVYGPGPTIITIAQLIAVEVEDELGNVRYFLIQQDATGDLPDITQIVFSVADYDNVGVNLTRIDDNDNVTITCFVAGTRIRTVHGEQPIETLRIGDLVITQDQGAQPIRWIGRTDVARENIAHDPSLRPVRFLPGALGSGLPQRSLMVSQQHRILLRSPVTKRMFGCEEVLVSAKKLIGFPGIELASGESSTHYFHLLFDQHQIVFAEGAASESLLLGPIALKNIGARARSEIAALEMNLPGREMDQAPARPIPKGSQVRQLRWRHLKNDHPLADEFAKSPA